MRPARYGVKMHPGPARLARHHLPFRPGVFAVFVTHHLPGPIVEVHAEGQVDYPGFTGNRTVQYRHVPFFDGPPDKLALQFLVYRCQCWM